MTRPWVEPGIEIHDHFEGSAHCQQCKGKCTLVGEPRLATELIRWMFERWVRGGMPPNMMERESLARHGIRIEECYNRAAAAGQPGAGEGIERQ